MITDHPFIGTMLSAALFFLVVMLAFATYRVLRGPSPSDRLQAIEALMTLLIAVIVVVALVVETPSFIDVGIALALFGFVATLSIARYISEGRMF
jgi:multicomponent Na+:H+ antiporter subunit F